ncbi:hypothetical protein T310_7281 [Rasamsonia emersonii CBS 393.64]|uniref:Uncharacterized protein n=1 Tax=Rasamsonia emersonii (strain ATCC 16479 / CBS 393.64 / IMI 116815) TaxID=1408163 RepID=A0A0F4YKK6_RASE3|nr:hypothetical protein T310_7281 [Rasamsonia emersonii CBS 393.64]KKA18759.1 hypothetical protein T310_7281 [Rasamsonia emersonii CBS 393.64]
MQLTRSLTFILLGLATSVIASPIVINFPDPEPEPTTTSLAAEVHHPTPLADVVEDAVKKPLPPNFKGPRDAEFAGKCDIENKENNVHCFPYGEIF